MNEKRIGNFRREEVEMALATIQTCVARDKFILSTNINRTENMEFTDKYNLTVTRIKEIISKIKIEDFCYGLHNEHIGYEHEILYVFCPRIKLPYGEKIESVDIYTKFNIINGERVIIISFHQRNYPVDYLFKPEEGAL